MPVILAEAPRHVGVGIRTALSQDLPRIMEIEELAFGGQWDYFNFKASLNDILLVAVDALTANLVGFLVACCCKVSRRAIILRVAVHPDYQGQGIATQLLEESFRELCKKDLDEVELDVDILKAGARHLYEKMGFRVVATFSPDFEEDDSFFLMRRKLGT
jgi:[ribosomal protein S18]-alanine N-acetyltransferase